jgi:hypothetical protein
MAALQSIMPAPRPASRPSITQVPPAASGPQQQQQPLPRTLSGSSWELLARLGSGAAEGGGAPLRRTDSSLSWTTGGGGGDLDPADSFATTISLLGAGGCGGSGGSPPSQAGQALSGSSTLLLRWAQQQRSWRAGDGMGGASRAPLLQL